MGDPYCQNPQLESLVGSSDLREANYWEKRESIIKPYQRIHVMK